MAVHYDYFLSSSLFIHKIVKSEQNMHYVEFVTQRQKFCYRWKKRIATPLTDWNITIIWITITIICNKPNREGEHWPPHFCKEETLQNPDGCGSACNKLWNTALTLQVLFSKTINLGRKKIKIKIQKNGNSITRGNNILMPLVQYFYLCTEIDYSKRRATINYASNKHQRVFA